MIMHLSGCHHLVWPISLQCNHMCCLKGLVRLLAVVPAAANLEPQLQPSLG